MFSPEASDTFICLLTIVTASETIRLADNFTMRLSETAEDVLYGVQSNGEDFIFLPMGVVLPTEDKASAPRYRIQIHDVTSYLIPVVRTLIGAPLVTLQVVLKSAPNVVQLQFPDFLMGAINYDDNIVSAELTLESMVTEPFPAYCITPMYFPGYF
jgi:hypothetical protein